MKILFALPGLHRFNRGAEIALISVATELANSGESVTLIGSGNIRPRSPYRFISTSIVQRSKFERFPSIPPFRSEYVYEEATFVPGLLRKYHPSDYDVTLTCGYPFTNWVLRRPTLGRRPAHIFITQNGDWPAYARRSEYRFFGCDGLVCTNPEFHERNKDRWTCCTIPNGVDVNQFTPARSAKKAFDLPDEKLIVLMVSALIPTKRVEVGIESVRSIPNAHLVIAGDGPLRKVITAIATKWLPGRFTLLNVSAERMPALYGAADVFLHLSKEESFGNVFLEAMASGIPIVGHDSPRLRWIVGDKEFLVNTDDRNAVVRAILAAGDEHQLDRIARVKRAALFSWQAIGSSYRKFLGEVVARSNVQA